jgi:hypothetical protein
MRREPQPPAKLWIFVYEFPLHFVLPDSPELIVNGFPSNGVCDTDEESLSIYIAASLDDRKMLEVVWHEVTHAINWAYELEKKLKHARLSTEKREEIVAQVHGEGFSQFFLDNPKFVRWYTHVVNRIRKERH